MPIKYDELMALKNLGQKYAYTDREVMLYAYGIGMGADPMDEKELAFVNEAVASPRASALSCGSSGRPSQYPCPAVTPSATSCSAVASSSMPSAMTQEPELRA